MRHMLIQFHLAILALISVPSFAETCAKFNAPLKGGYCIYPGTGRDVLYYFHGRERDANVEAEKRWADTNFYTQQLRDVWIERGEPVPTVISVSFGNMWLFNPDILHFFVQQVIEPLERSLGGVRGKRMVMGESMGGFNTLQVAFRTSLFKKAAILCAPLVDGLTPFSSPAEVKKYILASTAYSVLGASGFSELETNMNEAAALARYFFPTPEDWAAADPLALARAANVRRSSHMKVYVSAGYYDEFVLYEGNTRLVSLLKSKNFDVDWRPLWGGHCVNDIKSLARFLAN